MPGILPITSMAGTHLAQEDTIVMLMHMNNNVLTVSEYI
jgi:hypothetical protein